MKYNLILLSVFTIAAQAQQNDHTPNLEWSALFMTFLPTDLPPQEISSAQMFETYARANQQWQITQAEQKAFEAENDYKRLQNSADHAKLVAEQMRTKADAIKKANL